MAEKRVHILTVEDLIHMTNPIEFRSCLAKLIARHAVTDAEVDVILKKRSEWLWETYKPEDMEWHYQFYNRRSRRA